MKRAGAGRVDVVDLNAERLQTAVRWGAATPSPRPTSLEMPRGWDVVIDCTGVVAAIEDGLPRVDKGGTFLQFGVTGMHDTAKWNPYVVFNQEITITGSMAVLRAYERAAALFADGVLDPDVMISHRYGLEDYPKALQQFADGVGRKIQVNPGA
ncbi:hypothetical protein GCM10025868_20880 [Angustibacter aerolatus]|uniref:Alcohol dehydrogenase-like C-terminal domain-containing protein n=1 Tax=Angustibacter aerolatus TaxID=1162965 RepID=A0ABQ6JHF7_9ACTN|nr:zinc-binding dehydrogenase [Angustibacter aerolatus]GMA86838.1 hypothetical protein GCM10025868_20880 [Angustibacter aerolatus]